MNDPYEFAAVFDVNAVSQRLEGAFPQKNSLFFKAPIKHVSGYFICNGNLRHNYNYSLKKLIEN